MLREFFCVQRAEANIADWRSIEISGGLISSRCLSAIHRWRAFMPAGPARSKGGWSHPRADAADPGIKTIAASALPTCAENQKLSKSSTAKAQYWAMLETQSQRQAIPGTGTQGATA